MLQHTIDMVSVKVRLCGTTGLYIMLLWFLETKFPRVAGQRVSVVTKCDVH